MEFEGCKEEVKNIIKKEVPIETKYIRRKTGIRMELNLVDVYLILYCFQRKNNIKSRATKIDTLITSPTSPHNTSPNIQNSPLLAVKKHQL